MNISEISAAKPHNTAYSKALLTKKYLDTKGYFDKNLAEGVDVERLSRAIKAPTRADVDYLDVLKKNPVEHKLSYLINTIKLKKSNEVGMLRLRLDNLKKIAYPKTLKLREALMKNGRINLDTVTSKMPRSQKRMFSLFKLI